MYTYLLLYCLGDTEIKQQTICLWYFLQLGGSMTRCSTDVHFFFDHIETKASNFETGKVFYLNT